MFGNSKPSWNAIPTGRRSGGSPSRRSPSRTTVPDCSGTRPSAGSDMVRAPDADSIVSESCTFGQGATLHAPDTVPTGWLA